MSSEAGSTGSPVSFYDDDPAKTRRAAVESMTIHSEGDMVWTVYSGTKAVGYRVFALGGLSEWGCECADHFHRHCECKHIRRIQMCLGVRDVPETPGHSYPDVELMADSRARVAAQRAERRSESASGGRSLPDSTDDSKSREVASA